METSLAKVGESEIISSLVMNGDLSKLSPQQQVQYYNMFCDSLGLNPLTKPFDLVSLQGKKVLYANKNCAEQLRSTRGVSFLEMKQEIINDECVTTVKGQDKSGRVDVEVGVVSVKGMIGDQLANAMMKSATKAKRRLTLSLCSIGVLDETELETIPNADKQEINITGIVGESPEMIRKKIASLITFIPDFMRPRYTVALDSAKDTDLTLIQKDLYDEKEKFQAALKSVPQEKRQAAIDSIKKVNNDDEYQLWFEYIKTL